MELVRTASDVNDGLQEQLLKCFQAISALDSSAAQWYGLTQIVGPILQPIDLMPCMDEFTIFRNSRLRDMYWELWKVLAPIYHNNGCKSYPYQPLGKHEIRLISLIEHDGQKLVCRLDTYPHWLAPEYDAFSYAWGNPADTTIIICNEIELSIGTALHVALEHLLKGAARPLRPLWIDAICLNQQDDDEKAHQVPWMGNIYRLATRTLIWLGEAADDSDIAMRLLRIHDQKTQIGERRRVIKSTVALLRPSWILRLWTRKRLTDQNLRRVIGSIVALLQRPWFSRLWTMQEAALSQNCQVVCGGKSLEWSALQTFEDTIRRLPVNDLSLYIPIGLDDWRRITLSLLLLKRWRLAMSQGLNSPINEIFELSEMKDCKEPVDRIWAISALLPNSRQQRIKEAGIIDYSPLGREKYWKTYLTFLKLLYPDSPKDLWDATSFGLGLAKNPNLPSWCPDFNAKRHYNKFRQIYRAGFPDAKTSTTPQLRLSADSAVLVVKGFTCDTVQSVTQNIFPRPALAGKANMDLLRETREWLYGAFPLVHETLGMSQAAVVRLSQTLQGVEREMVSTEAWQQDQKEFVQSVSVAYENWHRSLDPSEQVLWKLFEGTESVQFEGRPFITTVQGRIGIGTADMRSGDMVCIGEGFEDVLVLRRVTHDIIRSSGIHSQEDLDQYSELFRLVGDAYIHGCMCGEAFTASGRGPDREFALA